MGTYHLPHSHQRDTHGDVPRHVVSARESGDVQALAEVRDAQDGPGGGEERVGEEPAVAERAREPPQVQIGVWVRVMGRRNTGSVD